tara:strand:+ start:720 stop:887 length:168 start_codon:yes stop_codon:yes gene_type:complete
VKIRNVLDKDKLLEEYFDSKTIKKYAAKYARPTLNDKTIINNREANVLLDLSPYV